MSRLLLALFASASLALPLAVGAPADPREGAAIVFAPWTSQADAFARVAESGGGLVRAGAFPFVAVAVAERPDAFARAVRAAGAWALLDPRALGGCLVPGSDTPA